MKIFPGNSLRVHEPLSAEKKLMSGNNISLNRQMTTPKNRMIESTNKEKRA